MADSTISIRPFPQEFSAENIHSEFKDFKLKRVSVNHLEKIAFVEFFGPEAI